MNGFPFQPPATPTQAAGDPAHNLGKSGMARLTPLGPLGAAIVETLGPSVTDQSRDSP